MEHLIAIQQQQIQGQYQMALRNYVQLSVQVKENPDLYYILLLNIGQCCMHLNDLPAAIQQLTTASSLKNTDWRVHHILSQVLFKQQQYQSCTSHIEQAITMINSDPNAIEIIDVLQLLKQRCLVEQAPKEEPKPTPKETTNNNTTINNNNPIPNQQQESNNPAKAKQQIQYTWHQTDKQVGLTLAYKIKSQDQVTVTINDNLKNITIKIKIDDSNDFELSLVLNHKVSQESIIQVNLQDILVLLNKQEQALNWLELEDNQIKHSSNNSPQPASVVQGATFYPSSNPVKRDWNKIDKELEKELNKNPEEDAMNKLFKQIYANGNEETKRAMVKSFQTSGGTVLSTNWGEVAKKDYEEKDRPTPPEGQKWEKWQQ